MKIAITGASGRLGQSLIKLLVNDINVDSIIALDLKPSAFEDEKLEFYKFDVCDQKINHFFYSCDAVIHLAFIVEHTRGQDLQSIYKTNVEGSKRVFNACAESGVTQIVYTSSIASYGINPQYDSSYLNEETPIKGIPDFYYAQNKAEIETWLDKFGVEHPELHVAILRPSVFLSNINDIAFFKKTFKRAVITICKGMDAPFHITILTMLHMLVFWL